MLQNTRRALGYLKRGVIGYVQNHCETIPDIPSALEPRVIGTSIEGRPIECFCIGNGPCKVLYAFGMHGNEVGTVKLAHHFLHWALENTSVLKRHSLYILPCLNPDGYSLAQKHPDYMRGGGIGRFNANGVDLNRNFATPSFCSRSFWLFGKKYSERKEVYCGKHGNSEPETQALTTFIQETTIPTVFVFHNCGRDVLGNRRSSAQHLAKIYSKETGFRFVSEDEWAALRQTGTAKEWCDLHDIDYIEIEGSVRWGSDWRAQKKAIIKSLGTIELGPVGLLQ